MKTTIMNPADVKREWHLVDATEKPVGRLAVKIAKLLRGKDKPIFTPHVDMGDFVIVINAAKVKLTGAKESQKLYKSYSLYPGGLKTRTAAMVRATHPGFLIEHAVRDMLPKNRLSRTLFKRLHVYAGSEHPHAAQQPRPLA
jgi:large subunit ribosomal protein L13